MSPTANNPQTETGSFAMTLDDASDVESHYPTQTEPSNTSSTPLTAHSTTSRRFPSDLKTIKCSWPNCTKTFNRPARLNAHLRSHTNDRPFKCAYPECDKSFLEEKHLKQHIKGSHTGERDHVCQYPGCDKAFLTATRLRRHAAVHEGAERFRCRGYDGCDKTFRKHQTLQRHIRTDHLGQRAFVCANAGCEAGFDSAGALKRHVDREHGEPKYWCDECGKDSDDPEDQGERVGFTTLTLLEAHMRREHINCLFCDVRCRGQADLERHVETYHSGSTVEDRKVVPCTWDGCDKKFTKKSNLNAHIRSAHEGVRFICGEVDLTNIDDLSGWDGSDACGNGFISKMKLEEHVRFVHLKMERPKAAKTVANDDDAADLVNFLAGVDSKRTIRCTYLGCDALFSRHHDLQIHLGKHQEGAISAAGGVDLLVSPPPLMAYETGMEVDGATPDFDGNFWIGDGAENFGSAYAGFGQDEWLQDEAEMRRLVDDGPGQDLAGFIDPDLFGV